MQRKPKLLTQLRNEIRSLGYSFNTEKTYVFWVRDFIIYHHMVHPSTHGNDQVRDYLNHLVNARHVSPSTQNQALSAILFLYRSANLPNLVWQGQQSGFYNSPCWGCR